jgi:hypothetical protein
MPLKSTNAPESNPIVFVLKAILLLRLPRKIHSETGILSQASAHKAFTIKAYTVPV